MGAECEPSVLRAALAACGGISDLTLHAAEQNRDIRVVAIQDPREQALAEVGERYAIASRHRRFEDLLGEEVDFVIVNSPNHLHREQVAAVVRAKKPCLVQKPMASDLVQARAMVATAAEEGMPLGVTMFEHSKPLHHQIREMVASGWLGEPTLLQALSAHDIYLKDPPPPDDWRRDPAQVGGGAFIQLALHQLNLARWILDREVVEVSMLGTRGLTVFEDESDVAALLFERGPAAHFAAGYAARASHFMVAGTLGTIQVASEHVLVRGATAYAGPVFTYDEPGRERVFALAELEGACRDLALRCEVHARFARWIRDGEDFPCTAESALRDMEVVDAAYRSHASRRSISLR